MATELIDELVIPHLEEEGVDYEMAGDDTVLVGITAATAGSLTVHIKDREINGADMLTSVVFSLAEFPEDRRLDALELCNELNQRSVGKFFVVETGGVAHNLDWHVADRSNREEVRILLSFARAAIDLMYPTIMLMRWGNATMEQVVESLENYGESAGSPALSDDEILKLLGDLDLEELEDDEDDEQR